MFPRPRLRTRPGTRAHLQDPQPPHGRRGPVGSFQEPAVPPEHFGKHDTVSQRFNRWAKKVVGKLSSSLFRNQTSIGRCSILRSRGGTLSPSWRDTTSDEPTDRRQILPETLIGPDLTIFLVKPDMSDLRRKMSGLGARQSLLVSLATSVPIQPRRLALRASFR